MAIATPTQQYGSTGSGWICSRSRYQEIYRRSKCVRFLFGPSRTRQGSPQALFTRPLYSSGPFHPVNVRLLDVTTTFSSGKLLMSSSASMTSPLSGGTVSEPTAACNLFEKALSLCTPASEGAFFLPGTGDAEASPGLV